MYNQINLNTT